MLIGPQIDQLTTEFAAIVTEQPRWCTALHGESIQHLHDMVAAESLAHLDRQAFTRVDIHHGQRSKTVPIDQLIRHKVQRPGVIWSRHQWPMSTNEDRFPPPWGPMTERQAFFPVEPIDEVLTHGPAFAVQEHANLPVGVPDAGRANSVIRWRSSVQGLR